MALKFTVHVVQSFIKGHRKSGVISIEHSRLELTHLEWNNVRFLPVTATHDVLRGPYNSPHSMPPPRKKLQSMVSVSSSNVCIRYGSPSPSPTSPVPPVSTPISTAEGEGENQPLPRVEHRLIVTMMMTSLHIAAHPTNPYRNQRPYHGPHLNPSSVPLASLTTRRKVRL